jgi:hypothetical protein
MESQNLIIWQKWVDPFGLDDIEELEDFLEEEDKFLSYEDKEEEEDKTIESPLKSKTTKQIRVIATPMGIIPFNENTASGKIFNFWIGHTTFDITKNIADIIETTSGVETLDIFTRYRFRIAVGKAFSDSEVMRDINNKIYKEL